MTSSPNARSASPSTPNTSTGRIRSAARSAAQNWPTRRPVRRRLHRTRANQMRDRSRKRRQANWTDETAHRAQLSPLRAVDAGHVYWTQYRTTQRQRRTRSTAAARSGGLTSKEPQRASNPNSSPALLNPQGIAVKRRMSIGPTPLKDPIGSAIRRATIDGGEVESEILSQLHLRRTPYGVALSDHARLLHD